MTTAAVARTTFPEREAVHESAAISAAAVCGDYFVRGFPGAAAFGPEAVTN